MISSRTAADLRMSRYFGRPLALPIASPFDESPPPELNPVKVRA
jgi:hypothetical protein